MRPMTFAILGAALGAAFLPGAIRADTYIELEHARANARAGGPISEQDAEILERYGCSSGTRSAFCEQLNRGNRKAYRQERRRVRDRNDD